MTVIDEAYIREMDEARVALTRVIRRAYPELDLIVVFWPRELMAPYFEGDVGSRTLVNFAKGETKQ